MNFVSNKNIIVLKIRISIIFSILSFLIGFVGIFNRILTYILFVLIIILYIFLIAYYSPENYKSKSYSISNDLIIINWGVFFRKSVSISLRKLQFIELIQTPVQKYFSLCSIVFYTSGSKATLSNIDVPIGNKIEDIFIRKINNEIL